MNKTEYRQQFPDCELIKHFPTHGGCKIVPGYVQFPIFGKQCNAEAHHFHHVIGGDKAGRTDDERNVLRLNVHVHEFVTDWSCAGRILSCWELRRKGCLDWAFLSRISRKCYPSIFETDKYLAAVLMFPWIEPYHRELTRRAA